MADSASLSTAPPAYGYIELITWEDGYLRVAGWSLSLDGPFDSIQARNLTTGEPIELQQHERPDLGNAVTFVKDSHRGGFFLQSPQPKRWDGTIDIELIGMRNGQPAGSMRVDVHCPDTPQSFPPTDVMVRATGNPGQNFWRATGIKAANDFLRALGKHTDLSKVGTLLEWGCGSGRLTKHLIDRLPNAKVSGTDIDVEAVEWAGANLKGRFIPCKTEPPLDFADDSFDVICALSVCTHLTKHHQDLWLPELRRITRPGGLCALTTHGEFASRWIFHRPGEYDKVMATGFFDGLADHNLKHVASGDYYRSTFQARDWTVREWGRWFEVVDFVEAGVNNFQDIFVLRRKD
ncbi:MAG: methyltransferase domain-containing protein [Planctomycetota bacterium]